MLEKHQCQLWFVWFSSRMFVFEANLLRAVQIVANQETPAFGKNVMITLAHTGLIDTEE